MTLLWNDDWDLSHDRLQRKVKDESPECMIARTYEATKAIMTA